MASAGSMVQLVRNFVTICSIRDHPALARFALTTTLAKTERCSKIKMAYK